MRRAPLLAARFFRFGLSLTSLVLMLAAAVANATDIGANIFSDDFEAGTAGWVAQVEPVDPATHPRPGAAEVDVTTGKFKFATSHKCADGVVKGKHRVFLMIGAEGRPAEALVPSEYLDVSLPPLEYDTSDGVLNLPFPKP